MGMELQGVADVRISGPWPQVKLRRDSEPVVIKGIFEKGSLEQAVGRCLC